MRIAWFVSMVSLAIAGCSSAKRPAQKEGIVRIGTYHVSSLVVAWVRSAEHARELAALVAARDAAARAGDEAKVAECERKGAESQDLAHRQIAGEAGTEDILERLKVRGDLAAVRKQAQVEEIYPENVVLGDRVEFVDVTDLLVDLFHPDDATRKVIADVRKYPKGVRVH